MIVVILSVFLVIAVSFASFFAYRGYKYCNLFVTCLGQVSNPNHVTIGMDEFKCLIRGLPVTRENTCFILQDIGYINMINEITQVYKESMGYTNNDNG